MTGPRAPRVPDVDRGSVESGSSLATVSTDGSDLILMGTADQPALHEFHAPLGDFDGAELLDASGFGSLAHSGAHGAAGRSASAAAHDYDEITADVGLRLDYMVRASGAACGAADPAGGAGHAARNPGAPKRSRFRQVAAVHRKGGAAKGANAPQPPELSRAGNTFPPPNRPPSHKSGESGPVPLTRPPDGEAA